MSTDVVRKVVLYVTRGHQLLVFDHRDHPEAGTQVPAGTVQGQEAILKAAIREGKEETGLTDLQLVGPLGLEMFREDTEQPVERHYFHFVTADRRDFWEHWETHGGSEGEHFAFRFKWIGIEAAKDVLHPEFAARLELLEQSLCVEGAAAEVDEPECLACKARVGEIELSPAPEIYGGEHWIVEHLHPTDILGWVVLATRKHRHALHDLTDEEWAEMSRILPVLCACLHELTGSDKEYLAQFAEAAGFSHVHVHVIPRAREWPTEWRGFHVHNAMGAAALNPVSADEMTTFACRLKALLNSKLGDA